VIYSPHLKLRDLAERLGCRLEGDGEIEIARVARITDAGPGDLTFLANMKYASALPATRASAVILSDGVPAAPCAVLRSSDPYLAFAHAMALFSPDAVQPAGVSEHALVAPDVTLGDGASVGAFAYVGRGAAIGARTVIHPHVTIGPSVVIGDDCIIYPGVSIRERCRLGHRVILQDGVVIGSDGYGFAPQSDGTYHKIPQVSIVVIEDDVEIGANSTVDRPAVGETRIRAGAKIDNLVQIAHGVDIGRNVLLASQVGISGSTVIGDGTVFGGQVGVAGHLHIGRGVRATGQTGIPNSVPDGAFISGYPAIENREWLKASIVFRRLPELKRAVAHLERRLAELESRLPGEPAAND
jgi:UDP-3-O-[3-hydroxymyristoyl] glucosamine N-acyltransferase